MIAFAGLSVSSPSKRFLLVVFNRRSVVERVPPNPEKKSLRFPRRCYGEPRKNVHAHDSGNGRRLIRRHYFPDLRFRFFDPLTGHITSSAFSETKLESNFFKTLAREISDLPVSILYVCRAKVFAESQLGRRKKLNSNDQKPAQDGNKRDYSHGHVSSRDSSRI